MRALAIDRFVFTETGTTRYGPEQLDHSISIGALACDIADAGSCARSGIQILALRWDLNSSRIRHSISLRKRNLMAFPW
jgi:hypothetical protein